MHNVFSNIFFWGNFILYLRLPRLASADGSNVLQLTIQNYEDKTNDKAIFVRFVTDWCEECEETAEEFQKLAQDWRDHPVGLVAEVYCDSENGLPICEEFEVAGYPSIYYGDPESPEIYTGKVDYDSMAEFAKNNINTLPCSVRNIEVCDDKTKAAIGILRQTSREELEGLEKKVLEKVKKEQDMFDKKAVELQKKYEELANAFNEKVERLRQESDFKWIQQILNEMLEAEEESDIDSDENGNNNKEEL